MMSVMVNGELREVPPDQTVASLLNWLKMPVDRIAVEVNQAIVRKRDWAAASVPRGARIEIVEFVGGG